MITALIAGAWAGAIATSLFAEPGPKIEDLPAIKPAITDRHLRVELRYDGASAEELEGVIKAIEPRPDLAVVYDEKATLYFAEGNLEEIKAGLKPAALRLQCGMGIRILVNSSVSVDRSRRS